MRGSGQGAHVSQTIIELAHAPDRATLDAAWAGFVADHPMVLARMSRNWRTLVPEWRLPTRPGEFGEAVPIGWWRERGAASDVGEVVESFEKWLHDLRHIRGGKRPGFNLRIDVLQRAGGRAALAVTWSHLLLDGKGVEFLLMELGRRCGEAEGAHGSASESNTTSLATTKPPATFKSQIERSRAFVKHFYDLAMTRFQSLGGPKPKPGAIHCRVVTLDREATAKTMARSEKASGPLIAGPYFLAASAVAHAAAFEKRGLPPGPQVITLPLQNRPKGGKGPIFQNFVTILFFRLSVEELASVESATKAIQGQFAKMMRTRLDASFTTMLDLMRRMPPRLYAWFIRRQMRGEITSFFHSYTGAFAPGLERMAGAPIEWGWHVPVISTPPGSGLFLSDRGGQLTISLSWREGCVDEAEQKILMDRFIEALVGEPATPLTVNLQA